MPIGEDVITRERAGNLPFGRGHFSYRGLRPRTRSITLALGHNHGSRLPRGRIGGGRDVALRDRRNQPAAWALGELGLGRSGCALYLIRSGRRASQTMGHVDLPQLQVPERGLCAHLRSLQAALRGPHQGRASQALRTCGKRERGKSTGAKGEDGSRCVSFMDGVGCCLLLFPIKGLPLTSLGFAVAQKQM